MPQSSQEKQTKIDPDKDRHRSASDAIEAVLQHEDFPKGPVERVEIMCHASGDVTWRIWTPRAVEPLGGFEPGPA